jgi:D-sedoheptulose 7-phosphate isomerase
MDNSPKSKTLTDGRALLIASLQEHLASLKTLLDTKLDQILQTGELICRTLITGNKVLLCGNGGSAADAQHIAAELVGRYELHRRAWPAIALTTDTSALTAISNDFGYEEVFARQVEALARTNDLLIAISTSGGSPNIIRAVEKAKEFGCKTIALAGGDGGRLASLCDYALIVPSNRTARVQEAHITIGHLWCEMVDAIAGEGQKT